MELIDREKLKIALCNICRPFDGLCAKGTCTAINVINQVPIVDAVEVIRCKDCKHSVLWCGEITCCEGIYINCAVDENFYCAAGERKTDEQSN